MKALLLAPLCFGLCSCDDVSMTRQKKDSTYAPSSVWSDGCLRAGGNAIKSSVRRATV